MGRRAPTDPVHDGEVLTLSISAGNKWNEQTGEGAVASYDCSIIFAPRGVVPGNKARLKLAVMKDGAGDIRRDSRGTPMYRSVPAPVEYIEIWRDNGDGTASRITRSRNWLMEESDEGVCETRQLVKRERHDRDEIVWRMVCGQSFADSYLERTTTKVVALEEERVQFVEIIWIRMGERPEPQNTEMVIISRWAHGSWNPWLNQKLSPVYADDQSVRLILFYNEAGQEMSVSAGELRWGQLANWFKDELAKPYPLCSCGRQRLDTPNISDGYTKCELCRNEDECDRCGRDGVKVKIVGGRRICPTCEYMAGQEDLAVQKMTGEQRQVVADEVGMLLTGRALDREAGEMVLSCTADYLPDMLGYAWYYFCAAGVFGSKFSPAALELLTLLPQAHGDGLVRMIAWLVSGGGRTVADCESLGDYYWKTQVKGEEEKPDIRRSSVKTSCAVRLRSSVVRPARAPRGIQSPVPSTSTSIASQAPQVDPTLTDLSRLFGGVARYRRK